MIPISIVSGGMEIQGFSSSMLTKNMESIAGYFSLSFMDKRSLGSRPLDIPFGDDVVEIYIGGRRRLRGYLEVVAPTKQPEGREITLAGRELTCDLVDCTIEKVRTVNGTLQVALREITRDLPLIEYNALSDVAGARVSTRIQPGESHWKTMERLSRKAGALLWTSGDGRVNIGTARADKIDLVLDERVIAAGAAGTYSAADIFTRYVIRGEEGPQESPGWGSNARSKFVHESDFLKRRRTLCIRGESTQSRTDSKKRAIWEANIRIARGIKATLPLRGLSLEALDLIDCNRIVRVRDASLGLDRDMLISGYTIAGNAGTGLTATIEVTLPGAFAAEPLTTAELKKEIGKQLQINW